MSLERLKHLPEHFRTLRLDKKIPAKVVIEKSDEKVFKDPQYKKITDMRFLESMKEFPCMVFIYGNNVAIYTLKNELVGIIIRNRQIAEAMKLVFDMYWKMANKA